MRISRNSSKFDREHENLMQFAEILPISWNLTDPPPQKKREDIFAGQTLVPGMSLYEFSQVSDAESQAVGDEEPMIFDS